MTTLFTLDELAVFMQRTFTAPQLLSAQLAHDLVLDEFLSHVGACLATPPQAGVKGLALDIAARVVDNPQGLRSETTGSYSWARASGAAGIRLTEDEITRLRRYTGCADPTASGAYTVTVKDHAFSDVSYCAETYR